MAFKVSAPLVILPNADGVTTDWYGYQDAIVPAGYNDERCKQLVAEGMLVEVTDDTDSGGEGDSPKAILAAVDGDVEKAQAALEVENAREKPRATVVKPLEKIIAASAGGSGGGS